MSRHAELVAQLEAAADRLTDRVLAEMYVDPFWRERFGARADKHGRQDGRFHVQYLQQALTSDDPEVLENYARWLQQVLTTRGMCTRHLAENFDRLALAIAHEHWPEGQVAIDLLARATAALTYADGDAREVQLRAGSIAEATAAALDPPGSGAIAPDRARLLDELATLISYFADALALASPQRFADHVAWLSGWLERRNVPRGQLVDRLKALRATIERELPGRPAIARTFAAALAVASSAAPA